MDQCTPTTNAVSTTYVPNDSLSHIEEVLRDALLFTSPKTFLPGLCFAATYAPAFPEQGPVGGDFFDVFALPGEAGEVALLVGDMTGKGVDAAVHIAAVKFALRAFLRESRDGSAPCPADALTRLSDFICQAQDLDGWDPGALVSVALVSLNPTTGAGRFALAAAEAPLVLPRTPRGVLPGYVMLREDQMPYGLPLGMWAGQEYHAAAMQLPDHATLVLVTDGLTEARRPERTSIGGIKLLGYEGVADLAACLHRAESESLAGMGAALMDGVRAYAGGKLGDDACVLLAHRQTVAGVM